MSMRSNRKSKKLLALPGVAALAVTMFAAPIGAQTLLDAGSSDDLVAPPAQSCPADAIILVEEVEFTAAGAPIDAPVLGVGNGLETSIEIKDFEALDAGVVEVVEVITYDAHTGRELWPEQDNEAVSVEFLLDGEVVGATPFTPDIEDGVNSAWVISNLGEIELEDGADEVRIVHTNEENNNDSVVVASACATFTAGDAAAGDAADDDEDGEESLTLAELIERNSGLPGTPDGELALTGANEIAFGIIALGIILFGIAFKIQSQDPEELTY